MERITLSVSSIVLKNIESIIKDTPNLLKKFSKQYKIDIDQILRCDVIDIIARKIKNNKKMEKLYNMETTYDSLFLILKFKRAHQQELKQSIWLFDLLLGLQARSIFLAEFIKKNVKAPHSSDKRF